MSLRVRLVLFIVALVALVASALSAVHLNRLLTSVTADVFERSTLAARQVEAFVDDHIDEHTYEYDKPEDIEQSKIIWNDIVKTDRDIQRMLQKMLTVSPNIPMELSIIGSSLRRSLVLIIHDSTQAAIIPSEWKPTGACTR